MPGDKARWWRFDQMRELNLWTLKDTLDEASIPVATRTPLQAQVGDFYASCVDQAAIDTAGLQPIASDLSRIAATTSKEDLLRVLGSRGPRPDRLFPPALSPHTPLLNQERT